MPSSKRLIKSVADLVMVTSGVCQRWFPKGWFWQMFPGTKKTGTREHSDVPWYQKPERGYMRMFPVPNPRLALPGPEAGEVGSFPRVGADLSGRGRSRSRSRASSRKAAVPQSTSVAANVTGYLADWDTSDEAWSSHSPTMPFGPRTDGAEGANVMPDNCVEKAGSDKHEEILGSGMIRVKVCVDYGNVKECFIPVGVSLYDALPSRLPSLIGNERGIAINGVRTSALVTVTERLCEAEIWIMKIKCHCDAPLSLQGRGQAGPSSMSRSSGFVLPSHHDGGKSSTLRGGGGPGSKGKGKGRGSSGQFGDDDGAVVENSGCAGRQLRPWGFSQSSGGVVFVKWTSRTLGAG